VSKKCQKTQIRLTYHEWHFVINEMKVWDFVLWKYKSDLALSMVGINKLQWRVWTDRPKLNFYSGYWLWPIPASQRSLYLPDEVDDSFSGSWADRFIVDHDDLITWQQLPLWWTTYTHKHTHTHIEIHANRPYLCVSICQPNCQWMNQCVKRVYVCAYKHVGIQVTCVCLLSYKIGVDINLLPCLQ